MGMPAFNCFDFKRSGTTPMRKLVFNTGAVRRATKPDADFPPEVAYQKAG